jgi:glycosyltransferase involved in cell wall biosynthesis
MIAVPVFEGWDYVAETLASIRAQSFTNIRVLISVEGGDERSYQVCRQHADDPRFELVQQPRRLGWPGNFNWLLGQLREDFLCYWQQDDLCDPSYLETLLDHALQHPEAAVVYSDIQHFAGKTSIVQHESVLGAPLPRVLDQIERSGAVPLRGVIRREAVLAAGPIPEGRKQETVWVVSLAREGELHRIPRTLYKRRIWAGSLSAKEKRVNQAEAYRATVGWALGMLAAALPVATPADHDLLLATIVDRMVVPKTGRRFYFNPKRAGPEDRLRLVTDFLRAATQRYAVVPFSGVLEKSDAEAILSEFKHNPASPAEALIVEAVLRPLSSNRSRTRSRSPSSFQRLRTGSRAQKTKCIGAMKKVLNFAAVAEAATGMALLIVPSLVGRLLLGEELTGVAIPVARVAGIALIALGVACWPGPPLVGMLTYSALVTLYLAYLGFAGGLTGAFLWPAVALHAILSVFLGRLWLAGNQQ